MSYNALIYNVRVALENGIDVDDPLLQINPLVREPIRYIKRNALPADNEDQLKEYFPPEYFDQLTYITSQF